MRTRHHQTRHSYRAHSCQFQTSSTALCQAWGGRPQNEVVSCLVQSTATREHGYNQVRGAHLGYHRCLDLPCTADWSRSRRFCHLEAPLLHAESGSARPEHPAQLQLHIRTQLPSPDNPRPWRPRLLHLAGLAQCNQVQPRLALPASRMLDGPSPCCEEPVLAQLHHTLL